MYEITSEDVKAALDRAEDKAQRFYGGDPEMLEVLYDEELDHLVTGLQIMCKTKLKEAT